MKTSLAVLIVAAALTASCDHFGGIDAYQPLAALPDTACFPRALESLEGVTRVQHHRTEWPTAPFAVTQGAVETTITETWTYRVGRLRPRVQIYNAGNTVSFSNGIGLTAGSVSDEKIAAYLPLIERVNRHLANECGLDLSGIEIRELHQP